MSKGAQITRAQRERIRSLRVTDPLVQDALAGFISAALWTDHKVKMPASEMARIIGLFGVAIAAVMDQSVDAFNRGFRVPDDPG